MWPMSMDRQFEVLEAWQAARALTRSVYELTTSASFTAKGKMKRQMQRASTALLTNIAEGFQSRSTTSSRQFLGRAESAAGELREQLFAALDGGCLTEGEFQGLQEQCAKCRVQISEYVEYLKNYSRPRSRIAPSLRP
jgi:four helix bundle protein